MDAQHYWLYVGLALGAGFVVGAMFGAYVTQHAYRRFAEAMQAVCEQIASEETDEEWE